MGGLGGPASVCEVEGVRVGDEVRNRVAVEADPATVEIAVNSCVVKLPVILLEAERMEHERFYLSHRSSRVEVGGASRFVLVVAHRRNQL